jgi:hypothetical protein
LKATEVTTMNAKLPALPANTIPPFPPKETSQQRGDRLLREWRLERATQVNGAIMSKNETAGSPMGRRAVLATLAGGAAVAAIPAAAAACPDGDAELLQLQDQIFAAREAADAHLDQIDKLDSAWQAERQRIIRLAEPHHKTVQELLKQIWSIPATTPEGRQAKFFVLLNFVLDPEWRQGDWAAEPHIKMTRDLLIEFVGGESADQLREQFA